MDDISTEELSDISQDKDDPIKETISKKESEVYTQIAELKEKLRLLEEQKLPELIKKWKKITAKEVADKRSILAYKKFLETAAITEYQNDLNEADAELESKREEIRNKLIQDYEEKKRALNEEKAQMDLCPNWIEMFENKNKRRLRPRDAKDDKPDDPLSLSIQSSGLQWLRKSPKPSVHFSDPKRKRLGHVPTLLTDAEILLTENEIIEDLKLIKTTRKRRENVGSAKKDVRVIEGKLKIGVKFYYKHEIVTLWTREGSTKEVVKILQITDRDVQFRKNDGATGRISLGKLAREKFKLTKSE